MSQQPQVQPQVQHDVEHHENDIQKEVKVKEVSQTLLDSFLMNRLPVGRPSHLTLHANRLYYLKPSKEAGNILNVFSLSKDKPQGSSVLFTLGNLSSRPMTKTEALMRERQRLTTHAILSYSFHEIDDNRGKLLISSGGSIFLLNLDFSDPNNIHTSLIEIETWKTGEATDVKLSPEMTFVSFIRQGNLFIADMDSNIFQLTFADTSREISCGVAEFIIQEEFDRYTGYEWAPPQRERSSETNIHRLCYFQVDESSVEVFRVSVSGFKGDVETQRYPSAGSNNATNDLYFVEFEQGNPNGAKRFKLKQSLKKVFEWFEYIPRFGWTPDFKIWLQLLDRLQQKMMIVTIGLSEFVPVDDLESDFGKEQVQYSIVHQEQSSLWYNVSDIIYFFGSEDGSKYQNKVLISSEHETGFRRLYLIDLVTSEKLLITVDEEEDDDESESESSHSHDGLVEKEVVEMTDAGSSSGGSGSSLEKKAEEEKKTKKTRRSGQKKKKIGWEVGGNKVWVDSKHDCVYFMSTKHSILEDHLYVSSLLSPTPPTRLSQAGFTHNIVMNKERTLFSTTYSSITSIYQTEIFGLVHNEVDHQHVGHHHQQQQPLARSLVVSAEWTATLDAPVIPTAPTFPQITPDIFSFENEKGDTIYGSIYKPADFDGNKKYAGLLYVYGGPHVQLITNSYSMVNTKWSLMAHLGYCVLIFDTYGSAHRGLKFEGEIREKMGNVEAAAQVDALQHVLSQHAFLDPNRIGVTGWSYGGYLSLVLYGRYPEVFKIAIAGAPVTDWKGYDTAYTERYMNLPQNSPTAYQNGSVLSLVDRFPDRADSLLIVHGMMDENVHFCHTTALIEELNRVQKPFVLQLYPDERHGIRKQRNSTSWEAKFCSFVLKNL